MKKLISAFAVLAIVASALAFTKKGSDQILQCDTTQNKCLIILQDKRVDVSGSEVAENATLDLGKFNQACEDNCEETIRYFNEG